LRYAFVDPFSFAGMEISLPERYGPETRTSHVIVTLLAEIMDIMT
jgi:hypothetical protein